MSYLALFAGFVYLLMGGDFLVRGSVALARRWRLSRMVVGVTVVALGTSAPELFVSVGAALTGHPGIAIGNVVGSNIANTLLVLGTLAALAPIAADPGSRADALVMVLATVGFVVLAWNRRIDAREGAVLLVCLAGFMARQLLVARRPEDERVEDPKVEWVLGLPSRTWMIVLLIGVGAAWLPIGAHLLVESAAEIAVDLGVSEAVIGLSIVALGTSLPELATVVIASVRKQMDVAVGNVIGSNILNILAILGAAAVAAPDPLSVPEGFRRLEFPVLVGSAIAVAAFTLRGRRLGRPSGIALVGLYVLYIGLLYGL